MLARPCAGLWLAECAIRSHGVAGDQHLLSHVPMRTRDAFEGDREDRTLPLRRPTRSALETLL